MLWVQFPASAAALPLLEVPNKVKLLVNLLKMKVTKRFTLHRSALTVKKKAKGKKATTKGNSSKNSKASGAGKVRYKRAAWQCTLDRPCPGAGGGCVRRPLSPGAEVRYQPREERRHRVFVFSISKLRKPPSP